MQKSKKAISDTTKNRISSDDTDVIAFCLLPFACYCNLYPLIAYICLNIKTHER